MFDFCLSGCANCLRSLRQRVSGVGDESCYAKKIRISRSNISRRFNFCVLNGHSLKYLSHRFHSLSFTITLQKNRTSIDAQKIVDERHGPFKVHNSYQAEMRTRPNFRQLPAISSYAGQDIGNAGSYSAMKSYQNGFAKRRDEILTEIAKND